MTGAEQARQAIGELTPAQMRAALACFWVLNPTAFYKAMEAVRHE